jgi:short-subunit dehydrogenase
MTERRLALITGASSGFGIRFAERFAADGFDVALAARSVAPMQELASHLRDRDDVETHVFPADLASTEGVDGLVAGLAERGLRPDALVNNAGFSTYGLFAEEEDRLTSAMLAVNVVALTRLTRATLPSMIQRGWGRVLMLGSVGSFGAAPMTAAYAATKAYVLSLSLALADELEGTGVTVTALCPGPTATGFQARAGMADSALIAGRSLPSGDAVADAGYDAMKRGKPYLVTGSSAKAFAFGSRVLPRTLVARIAGRSQRRITDRG